MLAIWVLLFLDLSDSLLLFLLSPAKTLKLGRASAIIVFFFPHSLYLKVHRGTFLPISLERLSIGLWLFYLVARFIFKWGLRDVKKL